MFTRSAQLVVEGCSPYDQHAYRYPPLLAWLMVPNVVFAAWGKVVFSFADLACAVLIFRMLVHTLGASRPQAMRAVMLFLYNPLTVAISTRGSADVLVVALPLIITLDAMMQAKYARAAMMHALCVHLRMFPVILLPVFLLYIARAHPHGPVASIVRYVAVFGATLLVLTASTFWRLVQE